MKENKTINIHNLEESMKLIDEGRCIHCGKKMKQQIDTITKKRSKYILRCDCRTTNLILGKL